MNGLDRLHEWLSECLDESGYVTSENEAKLRYIICDLEKELEEKYVPLPVRIKARTELERENSNLYGRLSDVSNSRDAERAKRMKLQKKYSERVGSLLDLLRDARDEYVALRDDMVRLPVDADGQVIRVGDILHGYGMSFEVRQIVLDESGEWTVVDRLGERFYNVHALSHEDKPTVEDTLREFADLVRKERVELATISEDIIAEYAAKFRLADEKEQQ